MDAGVKRFLMFAGVVAVLVGGALLVLDGWRRTLTPAPETIATAALSGLREQNRLSAFAARFVAVVTSQETRYGLNARKTLILPGMVRYEVDLARLSDKDVHWDGARKTLFVALPPIEIAGPDIDLTQIREYDAGGILLTLTNAGAELDAVNRKAGQVQLLQQAHEDVPERLARDATRTAVARSFAMPLRAAGVDAEVRVTFADEK